ncbi:hypothetical protein ACFOJE_13645 [Azotobacter bryophylli]|uniref:Uncharacterized protein n=1 Tax=Azotobacter bryophylli TaxID=1986537 RepID=A0ABV7AUN9_9GAMM
MRILKLTDIHGIHPDFSHVERELDLAPVNLPDLALIPKAIALRISEIYPLVISSPDLFCIGHTTLYRWLMAYMDPETSVRCIEWPYKLTKAFIYQLVLSERLIAPALARITPQQVRDLYRHITHAPEQWPHEYRSYAHLAQLVGVKPLTGTAPKKRGDA